MIDLSPLIEELKTEEGFRGLLYDDKTGKPVVKGSTLLGNPTIGYGWNLSGKELSDSRGAIILGWFVQDAYQDVLKAFPWISNHNNDVQLALVDLCFNTGVDKLKTFTTFLDLVQQKKYKEAGDDLDKTLWAKQVGPIRSHNVEELIRNPS